jgi:hypothetical protein
MSNLHPIFQTIIASTFPVLAEEKRCTICGEIEEDCICETCPWCGISDVPINTLNGRECPACGEFITETREDMDDQWDDDAFFKDQEVKAMNMKGY